MKSHSVSSKPSGNSSASIMDFDAISKIIAAAHAERAKYIAAHLRSLGKPWKLSPGLSDFMRASQLIATARASRSAIVSRLLPAWLRRGDFKRGHAGPPKYS